MKILNNIAGAIIDSNPAKLRVNLYTIWSEGEYPTFNLIESCSLDTISRTVIYPLSPSVKLLLEMEYITYDVYEDYETLLSKLELEELPKTISKAWYPIKGEKAFVVDESDEIIEIISTTLDEKSIKTYKYFPTKELAKKSINLSKLDRLILLWQYSNNYLFTPDWKNSREIKYYFTYNHTTENLEVVNFTKEMGNSILFKTKYHVKDFITLYANEILKLLSVHSTKGEDCYEKKIQV